MMGPDPSSSPLEELPAVSVIVNTLDRATSLTLLLDGLSRITYPNFEVIVVVGPCTDDTLDVLDAYRHEVKIVHCPDANLSMSRNIGVRAAATAYVAFIDDDAVPEPRWLDELMSGFRDGASWDTDVAAVGGLVYDHTGYTLQSAHTGADRLGNARPDYEVPLDLLSVPGSLVFPYVPGGNAVYRRDRLIEVGGFDEEYEYYLEETDLCVRLIDRGWALRQVDGGAIHHKFLPSGIRTSNKVLRDRHAVIKNKIYFSLVNGLEYHSMTDVIGDDVEFAMAHRRDAEEHHRAGRLTRQEADESIASIDRAWEPGLTAGMRGRVALGFEVGGTNPLAEDFRAYPRIEPTGRRLRLCFVTQTIPPTVIGGIGRYFMDLARELAARGHEIHVITTGEGHDTVDLEDGVWVHRILKDGDPDLTVGGTRVPPRLAANANAVADEVARMSERELFDVVYAAMWDVEHLAVITRGIAPTTTALVTTFGISLRTRPEWAGDPTFMAEFGEPLLALESWVLVNSTRLHAISRAIVDAVETTSGVGLGDRDVVLEPLGEVDHFPAAVERGGRDRVTVLFIGRFEKRKGIDLLLSAIPDVLVDRPHVRVVLVGRNDLPGEDGRPYADVFVQRHRRDPWFERVEILGTVDDDRLRQLLGEADVLVAPSRFESFGLVYLEGMMASLPVVALDEGAAVEVVEQGVTGLLIEPDSSALAVAIGGLCDDPGRRWEMGGAGRRRFVERYGLDAMTDGALRLFLGVDRGVRASLVTPNSESKRSPEGEL